jgi:nitrogen fixation/metabolism regulation signal transduction histidine kinase
MSIKFKLIILFILIKVIPIIIIAYIAIQGAFALNNYFDANTKTLFNKSKSIIETTANNAISDSIKSLDEKSQENLEKMSAILASSVASFLYERNSDLIFLANSTINQKNIDSFYKSKYKNIMTHDKYKYNEATNTWEEKEKTSSLDSHTKADNKENERKFNLVSNVNTKTKSIPIYKEIAYLDLKGNEVYKVSQINTKKLNVFQKENTYIKAESYTNKISTLSKGQIYVSNVIGAYIKSNIIGTFTKAKAEKFNLEFKPENHAYAGLENPNGKKFDGIIRFITPVFKNNIKTGYVSMALDHRHIMEYTDSFKTIGSQIRQEISDASAGNYAFMWDYKGRNISHPRDYFIVGYDPKTGEKVKPWVSKNINDKFESSNYTDLNKYLEDYPIFDNQSLDKKPNLKQLKEGTIALDCRYLNFAPQCEGWMQLTKDGGYGSFIIFWSKVWKLTTAASIPYYTGQYKDSKRGFGFVTIGANVDDFHSAANITKENLESILDEQISLMKESVHRNNLEIVSFIKSLLNELSVYSFAMILAVIFIAIWLSNYISNKINKLILGTKEFSENNLDYKIEVNSNDEIGKLEHAFNEMAENLKSKNDNLKEKDKLMFQQSKMAAMGEMLENIAHQWRQPLSMISSTATGLIVQKQLNLITDKELTDKLQHINQNTEYLSKTIDDFKNFFSPDKTLIEFDIKSIVDKTINILKLKFKDENIKIIEDIKSTKIYGLENELIQVIMNLLNNAKDALENQQTKLVFISLKSNEEQVFLELKDNAGGIKKEIMDRIFEPYFTTKHKSKGTGIGLYMSQEIVSKHMNGNLTVRNEQYKYENVEYSGAVFTISLQKRKTT